MNLTLNLLSKQTTTQFNEMNNNMNKANMDFATDIRELGINQKQEFAKFDKMILKAAVDTEMKLAVAK